MISQWTRTRSCAAVTVFVVAICVCGTEAAALTLPSGPTGPTLDVSTTTIPDAPTLSDSTPSTSDVSTPELEPPKLSTPEVRTPTVSTPKLSSSKLSAPTTTVENPVDSLRSTVDSAVSTSTGTVDQASGTLSSSPLRSGFRLASRSTSGSGGGTSGTLAGLTGGGSGSGGGTGVSGGGGGGGGGLGAGDGGGDPLASAALMLRAEAGLLAGALTSNHGAGFEALQAAVATLAGCVGDVDPLERRLLVLRFGLDGSSPRSLGAVARALGISRAGALRTERRALRSLRVASTTTGCAASGSGIATIFDPSTIGLPAGALLGASARASGLSGAGPLAAGAVGAAAPAWPRPAHGNIGSLLIALATIGALLTLAGMIMRGWLPPLPVPAETRAPERIGRPRAPATRRVRAPQRGPQPLAPRARYRRPDRRGGSQRES